MMAPTDLRKHRAAIKDQQSCTRIKLLKATQTTLIITGIIALISLFAITGIYLASFLKEKNFSNLSNATKDDGPFGRANYTEGSSVVSINNQDGARAHPKWQPKGF